MLQPKPTIKAANFTERNVTIVFSLKIETPADAMAHLLALDECRNSYLRVRY
jgi:hypothetical protein